MIFNHKSVLLNETVDSLCVKPQGIYVDGTLGGGGHASEVAARLGDGGRLIRMRTRLRLRQNVWLPLEIR